MALTAFWLLEVSTLIFMVFALNISPAAICFP